MDELGIALSRLRGWYAGYEQDYVAFARELPEWKRRWPEVFGVPGHYELAYRYIADVSESGAHALLRRKPDARGSLDVEVYRPLPDKPAQSWSVTEKGVRNFLDQTARSISPPVAKTYTFVLVADPRSPNAFYLNPDVAPQRAGANRSIASQQEVVSVGDVRLLGMYYRRNSGRTHPSLRAVLGRSTR